MSQHNPQRRRTREIPKIWLMTDARNDDCLEHSITRLPQGSGVVFRHYHLEPKRREERFAAIRKLADDLGLFLLLSDSPALARQWRADGVHGRGWNEKQTSGFFHSAAVHNETEIAASNHADLLFLSPVFPTRSHPEQEPLSLAETKRLVGLSKPPVILLGGMNAERFQELDTLDAHGWAAIDALSGQASKHNQI